MKKLPSFGLTLILASVVLTACTTQTPENSPTADSALDDRILQEAVSNLDIERCPTIIDAAKKTECQKTINGLQLTNQAVTKQDPKICDKIEIPRYQENCLQEVDFLQSSDERDRQKEEERAAQAAKVLDIEAQALAKKDPEICNQIEDENSKYSCRYNVIIDDAIAKKDPSLCDKIGQKTKIEVCRQKSAF